MPLTTTIITSKYGLRRVKTLPSNTAIAFIEEQYEEGFGPANLVNDKKKQQGIIRFETRKSQYSSGKYLNYILVKEKITDIKSAKLKGLSDASILIELESISYILSKGQSIYGDENSFSGSVVFGRPREIKENKEDLASKQITPDGKGIKLLNNIFENVKGEIDFAKEEFYALSSAQDMVTESASLEVKQYKYKGLKNMTTQQTIDSDKNFYKFKTETSSFDGNGNILGSLVISYKPKNSDATSKELQDILEKDVKNTTPPSKVFSLIKELGYKFKTKESFYEKPLSSQYSMDAASLNGVSTVTFSNSSLIAQNGCVSNTTEELIDQENPKGTKLIVKGTITGWSHNRFKLQDNKKFKGACQGFDDILNKYSLDKSAINKPGELKFIKFKSGELILTNIDINYGVSNGTVTFSFTAESRADLSTKITDFLYLNVSWLEPKAVHWANSFLILGGTGGKGEELMQDSKQSRPLEYVLKVNGIMREYDKLKEGFGHFKTILTKNKKKILKSASFNYNYASKSIDGTAVFVEFDQHREIKDDSLKSNDPKSPK